MSAKPYAALMFATLVAATNMHAQQPALPSTAVACDRTNAATTDHAAMDHATHQATMHTCAGPLPTLPGQAAFGAISEVVRLLEADSSTDWSHVNIEALRQHLIDMDDVTLRAVIAQRSVAGGAEFDVTGNGRTVGAIQRMAVNHSRMLEQGTTYRASTRTRANGAHITITARDASDSGLVARIRGLGFAGLMTEGDHHAAHHLAIARGDPMAHERK